LPNWYLGKLAAIKAKNALLKEQYQIILRSYENDQRQLEYRWGDEFKATVLDDLAQQKGSKRSVDYLQGRAGLRKGKDSLAVLDEAKAIAWAKDNSLPEAVKTTESILKTPLLEQFLSDGLVPDGCEFVSAADAFYPAPSRPLLTKDGE